MAQKTLKPGQNTGKDGGIYAEQNTRGRRTGRFATIADGKHAPPTQKRGYIWELDTRTPNSK